MFLVYYSIFSFQSFDFWVSDFAADTRWAFQQKTRKFCFGSIWISRIAPIDLKRSLESSDHALSESRFRFRPTILVLEIWPKIFFSVRSEFRGFSFSSEFEFPSASFCFLMRFHVVPLIQLVLKLWFEANSPQWQENFNKFTEWSDWIHKIQVQTTHKKRGNTRHTGTKKKKEIRKEMRKDTKARKDRNEKN